MKPLSLRMLVCTLLALGAAEAAAFPNPFRRREPQSAPAPAELRVAEQEAGNLLREADRLEAEGRSGQAGKIYRRVVDRFPLTSAAPVALFKLAASQEREGKYQRAFDTYQELLDTYRQSPQFGEALERQTAIAMQSRTEKLGSIFGIRKMLDPSQQLEMFRKIIANAPRGKHAAEAQFEIAKIHEEQKDNDAAIAAYKKVVEEYPNSPLAAEAQAKISTGFLDKVKEGSRDTTNLKLASEAIDQADSLFPDPASAPPLASLTETREQISDLAADNAWKTGQFYDKKGNTKAALIYYSDVLRSPGSAHYERARERINEITSREPNLAATLPANLLDAKDLATRAAVDVKGKPGYFGPPPPPSRIAAANNTVRKPQMRGGGPTTPPQIPITPLEEPDLPAGTDAPQNPDDTLLNPGDMLPESIRNIFPPDQDPAPAPEPPDLPPPSEPAPSEEPPVPAPAEEEAPTPDAE